MGAQCPDPRACCSPAVRKAGDGLREADGPSATPQCGIGVVARLPRTGHVPPVPPPRRGPEPTCADEKMAPAP
jgi:hypothetical protein